MPTMKLEIVTAERLVYEDQVNAVVAPGIEGQLGILPRHVALLTTLQPGELTIRKDGEEDVYMAISGGFLEVMNNRVVVLADTAERVDEIDERRAEEAMRRAQEQLDTRTEDASLEGALTAIMRSQTRLKVVRRRGRSLQPPA